MQVTEKPKRIRIKAAPECPECGIPMKINHTGETVRYWYCPDPDCCGSRTLPRDEMYREVK